MTDHTPAKLKLIADAELRRARGGHVAPVRVKAVLLVLAAHEGEYVSVSAIADRAAIDKGRVVDAMNTLRRMGVLVSSDEGYHRMKAHTIRWHALAAMSIREPLYRRGGVAPRRLDAKGCQRRVRDAKYRARVRMGLAGKAVW